MDIKIRCTDYWLKQGTQSVRKYDSFSMSYYTDSSYAGDDIRLVGTDRQINDFFAKTELEIKDSWDSKLKERYIEGYKNNGNKLLIIKLT